MAVLSIVAALAVLSSVMAVDRNNFKTCDQSSFCKRNRAIEPGNSQFAVDPRTILPSRGKLSFQMVNKANGVRFKAEVSGFQGSTMRLHVNELAPRAPRYEVKSVLELDSMKASGLTIKERTDKMVALKMEDRYTVVVHYDPVRLDFFNGEDLAVSFNGRGLLNFEHRREKPAENAPAGEWDEDWKTHKDSKPNGPESIGFDISFPGTEHVYGIPEHATTMSLKTTKPDTDPYRLYNLDVFEYELDNPMALYGSIPFMVAHRPRQTSGVFFLNSAEMWIDIEKPSTSKGFTGALNDLKSFVTGADKDIPQTDTHWIAESGVLDLFVFMGPTPKEVFHQYAVVTGFPSMPPLFSLAYHQCRWNYNDEADVHEVSEQMDANHIPTDVIWLDIEHTDGKRYMTWDTSKFPEPAKMQNELAVKGRKMVNIVDPHIKRASGYHIHDKAGPLGYYVKNRDGNDFDGWCWPGSSSWLDFMDPKIQRWWAEQLSLENYAGTTLSMYFWNDMNEPSVFNGPEITMHKDNKHWGGWEHRDVHNIWGMWQQAATAQGITMRSGGVERPFVLSRAFFSGSQKYGAIWTGDNKADWGHMAASIPMILSIGIAGLPFAGADMGGFFHNPEPELLSRWYQIGSHQPFMRAHAHLDTKRREPYILKDDHPEHFEAIREAVVSRYTWLNYWYTLFYETTKTGDMVMRPLWVEFPADTAVFAEETKYMVGSALLVAPALEAGQTTVSIYFPGTEPWYDVDTKFVHLGGAVKSVAAPLRKIPVFQRGGSIVPRKMRKRRASALMHDDPFTFEVALDDALSAEGTVFIDDYHTYAYENEGKYIYASLAVAHSADMKTFTFTYDVGSSPGIATDEWVERITIAGFPYEPSAVAVGASLVGFTFDMAKQLLTLKKPLGTVTESATITISM